MDHWCAIRNRIATLTNTDVNIFDVLGDGILRRCMMLFQQDYVQDEYTSELYYEVASKHFAQKCDHVNEEKYRIMAIDMANGGFV